MSNIIYCRFAKTSNDIEDCIEALNASDWDLKAMIETASSKQEARGMKRFVNLCKDVAESFDDDEDF